MTLLVQTSRTQGGCALLCSALLRLSSAPIGTSIAYTTLASVQPPSLPRGLSGRMTSVASRWLKEPRTCSVISAGFSGGARSPATAAKRACLTPSCLCSFPHTLNRPGAQRSRHWSSAPARRWTAPGHRTARLEGPAERQAPVRGASRCRRPTHWHPEAPEIRVRCVCVLSAGHEEGGS